MSAEGGRGKEAQTKRPASKLRRAWDFLTGTWPGRIAAIVGFVPAAWGAWEVIDRNFVPAQIAFELECHPQLLVIHATNSGGRTANLGDPSFQMMSLRRWEDRQWHDRSLSALDNPVNQHRQLAPHESWPYEYRPGFPIYDEDEMASGNCQFQVSLPYSSTRGRHEPVTNTCPCGR